MEEEAAKRRAATAALEAREAEGKKREKNKRRGEQRKASRQAAREEVNDKRVSVSYCVRL